MQSTIRWIVVVLATGLLAILALFLLRPFLPPQYARYLAVGLAFGAVTFVEEAYVKQSPNALRQAGVSGILTVVVLFVLDLIW